MLYTTDNVQRGTRLTDLDTRQKVERVISIDTVTGEVIVGLYPWRLNAAGDGVETETIRFAAVWPILERGVPCHFQCHGRR